MDFLVSYLRVQPISTFGFHATTACLATDRGEVAGKKEGWISLCRTFGSELPNDLMSLSPTSAGCIAVSNVREIVFVRCQRRYTVS